jgi:hypothetical protein
MPAVEAAFAAGRTRTFAPPPDAEALLGLPSGSPASRWSAGADLITDDHPSMEFFRRYGRTVSIASRPARTRTWLVRVDPSASPL